MSTHKIPKHEEVAYLRGDRNYTFFHLSDGRKLIFSRTLRLYEFHHNLVYFIRVNKSYLLNPTYMRTIERLGNKITIQMQDGVQVRVSRKKIKMIKIWLNQYNNVLVGTNRP